MPKNCEGPLFCQNFTEYAQRFIRWSIPHPDQYTKYQGPSSNSFLDTLLKRSDLNFEMGRNSGAKNLSEKQKKIQVSYFSIMNPYMKFQDPSMHGLKFTRCMNAEQDKSNIPHQRFGGGIIHEILKQYAKQYIVYKQLSKQTRLICRAGVHINISNLSWCSMLITIFFL